MPAIPCRTIAIILLGLSGIPMGWPAGAETLHLRNGTRLEGRIQKQDDMTLEVVTATGIVRVPRESVAPAAPPNPWIALGMGVALPGGGQVWLGQHGRSWTVAGVTLASGLFVGLGSQAALTGRLIGADGSLAPGALIGVLAAMVPWGLGAWEAWQFAEEASRREQTQPRLRVDY